nr:DUF4157 domain-containing protein [Bacteroidota bacterium]
MKQQQKPQQEQQVQKREMTLQSKPNLLERDTRHPYLEAQNIIGNHGLLNCCNGVIQPRYGHKKNHHQKLFTETTNELPPSLKSGLEQLSGLDLSGVKVHRNSDKPSQINASAYTIGREIYLAPGQDKHLPHESWHVVQQLQNRVKPTSQVKGVSINNDLRLEREADIMGTKAFKTPRSVQNKMTSNSHLRESTQQQEICLAPTAQLDGGLTAAGFTILGLTISELTSIVAVTTGVAATIGASLQAQNNKTSKGPIMKLKFDNDYLMSSTSKAQLENISHALFFLEMERTYSSGKEEDRRLTAIKNVKQKIIECFNRDSKMSSKTKVANGAGGTSKETPWGEVVISLKGGIIYAQGFDKDIFLIALKHDISILGHPVNYIEFCYLDYNF